MKKQSSNGKTIIKNRKKNELVNLNFEINISDAFEENGINRLLFFKISMFYIDILLFLEFVYYIYLVGPSYLVMRFVIWTLIFAKW